ncbi:hypothetical protein, partial [Methanocalculus sp.]|uniref:hypothetical protein n=1 Tax=Methanocalculus sp. TaxID=2004547 RepID=UPI00272A5150
MVSLKDKENRTNSKISLLDFSIKLLSTINVVSAICYGLIIAYFGVGILLNSLYFDYIFENLILLIVAIIVIVFSSLYFFYLRYRIQNNVELIIVFLLIVWIAFQLIIVVDIEYTYQSEMEKYKHEYFEAIEHGNYNELNASWLLTQSYAHEMYFTYGQVGVNLPNRVLFKNDIILSSMYFFSNPLVAGFSFDENFYNKLVFTQKKGNCQEFAEATAFIVSDVTGLSTRVIGMKGVDHAFPELYYIDNWWVFDKTYTTSNSPVKDQHYATHLKENYTDLYFSIADLQVSRSKESTLKEHGFPASNVTIIVLFDTINDNEPNRPLSNIDIGVYAVSHQRNPLVYIGKTDENGTCNLVLAGNKEYLIVSR